MPDDPVYGPEEWRELNSAPLPNLPGASYQCAALKADDGEQCRNQAIYGTPFCKYHGGTTVSVQEQARRRIEAVKATLFDKLIKAADLAINTYIEVAKAGEKDADRLKAADRILELLGMRDDVVTVQVAGTTNLELTDTDARLIAALRAASNEKLQQAIPAASRDTEQDADA